MPYRVVSRLNAWMEDRYNASFAHSGSSERVCMHPDCMVTVQSRGSYRVECDYCPVVAVAKRPEGLSLPMYYYRP